MEPIAAKGSPEGSTREPKGAQREPKGPKGSRKGAKREPKGAQREPKARPKGAKGGPKWSQKPIQERCPKKVSKKVAKMTHFGAILGAKIDKNSTPKLMQKSMPKT